MEEFPRKGSALYDMLRGDEETKKRSLATWKRMNRVVVFLYELGLLPLIGIGRYILLLYTVGRKSGKARVNPLEYRRRDDAVLLFSARGKASDWYRNLKAHPEKTEIRIGFKKSSPKVEFVDDPERIKEIMHWYIQKFPGSSKMLFGWNKKKDDIETAGLSSLAEALKIIQLSPA
jgi:deazaflavin-dependent oxidoreductase (nitroreductase family)